MGGGKRNSHYHLTRAHIKIMLLIVLNRLWTLEKVIEAYQEGRERIIPGITRGNARAVGRRVGGRSGATDPERTILQHPLQPVFASSGFSFPVRLEQRQKESHIFLFWDHLKESGSGLVLGFDLL